MNKRKGQMSQATISRLWPHQVAILGDDYRGPLKPDIDAFCKPYPHSGAPWQLHHDGRSYLVKCFPEKSIADEFIARFGGERFDPRERGKGKLWFEWRKGSVSQRQ
ncbi:MAG: hypothetical protein QE284_18590 [Rhizobium sp.]|nr:hypothetical protein [Rhizobium sp.]